jgi:hypothetical protein
MVKIRVAGDFGGIGARAGLRLQIHNSAVVFKKQAGSPPLIYLHVYSVYSYKCIEQPTLVKATPRLLPTRNYQGSKRNHLDGCGFKPISFQLKFTNVGRRLPDRVAL